MNDFSALQRKSMWIFVVHTEHFANKWIIEFHKFSILLLFFEICFNDSGFFLLFFFQIFFVDRFLIFGDFSCFYGLNITIRFEHFSLLSHTFGPLAINGNYYRNQVSIDSNENGIRFFFYFFLLFLLLLERISFFSLNTASSFSHYLSNQFITRS